MKNNVIFIVSFLMCSSMYAKIEERDLQHIYLKNGSVLNGYIAKQDTKGNYTIRTESATICLVNGKYATKTDTLCGACFFKDININKVSLQESELSDAWKNWAELHDAYTMDGRNRMLTLSDVTIDGVRRNSNVRILENGSKVKYLEFNENIYNIEWKNVASIQGDMRLKTDLSGINRVYQTANGRSYEGQFANETDNTLGLYIDGAIETFDINDVVKYTFKPFNTQQDIFEQSPLIETVRSKNGNEVSGIIVEQNYMSKKNQDNYILVLTEGGAHNSVKMSDLDQIRRSPNSRYTPRYDIVLKEGEVQVNRTEVKKVGVSEREEKLFIDSCQNYTVVKHDNNQINVEYRVKDYPNAEVFQLVKLNKMTIKKSRKEKVTSAYITYKDLATPDCHPTTTEKTTNSVKAIYSVNSTGDYALYDSRKKEAIILRIE